MINDCYCSFIILVVITMFKALLLQNQLNSLLKVISIIIIIIVIIIIIPLINLLIILLIILPLFRQEPRKS